MAIFDGRGAREMIFLDNEVPYLFYLFLPKVHFISELYQKEIVKALNYRSVNHNTKKKKCYVEHCRGWIQLCHKHLWA